MADRNAGLRRGLDADPILRLVLPRARPQVQARGHLRGRPLGAIEAIDAGVTTTVDWSHGLQTVEHAAAALEALKEVPARFVLAYGNIQAGPWEWTAQPEVRRFRRVQERPTTGWASSWRSTSPAIPPFRSGRRSRWLAILSYP